MKFPSKQDWWLALIVWGGMLFTIGSGVYSLLYGVSGFGEMIVIVGLAVLLPIFVIWMWLTTYYVIDDNALIVKFGPFAKSIPLHSIRSVKKTNNPLSSPALSLRRLEIAYGKYDTVLISPVDRDEFMRILAERCPHAEIKTS